MDPFRRYQRVVGWLVIGVLAGAILWRASPARREPPLHCASVMGVAWPGGRAAVCSGRPRLRVSELLVSLSLPAQGLASGRRWVRPGELVLVDQVGRAVSSRLSAAEQLALGCPLDLNGLSPADLELLPRIGPKLAARVVAHRQRIGRFSSVEQLQEVRGIGPTTVRRLALDLRVGRQGVPWAMGFPCTGE